MHPKSHAFSMRNCGLFHDVSISLKAGIGGGTVIRLNWYGESLAGISAVVKRSQN